MVHSFKAHRINGEKYSVMLRRFMASHSMFVWEHLLPARTIP